MFPRLFCAALTAPGAMPPIISQGMVKTVDIESDYRIKVLRS